MSTIGKTVNRNMTQRRIDWEASFDSDACRSSTSLAMRRCRKSSQTTIIPNTNRNGKTVVATRRLWKLLSTKQFSGNTEMSIENSEKCPQKEVKRSGKSARKISVRRVKRRLALRWEKTAWHGKGILGQHTYRIQRRDLGEDLHRREVEKDVKGNGSNIFAQAIPLI